jgi:succinate-acetate transporter protein
VASFRTSAVLVVTFGLLTVTFLLLAIGNSGEHTDIIKAGGYFGLATAAAAWYASFAAVVNSTFGRVVMPVVSLKR